MKFNELTIDEQDLIAMLRRLEDRVGPERAQLVVFEGDSDRAGLVQSFVLGMERCEQVDYNGLPAYLALYIPLDAKLREQYRDTADEMLNLIFQEAEADIRNEAEE